MQAEDAEMEHWIISQHSPTSTDYNTDSASDGSESEATSMKTTQEKLENTFRKHRCLAVKIWGVIFS
ncbi:hypothetical protein ATANTOWER_024932 [Ataeniobius toweri]|uniref:Uncharacterized protein n=1 Tax=Ataeniobius toweri TaxID=208326 RepID=A0ABU7AUH2_9TELE|nr:hypothetical protein [Ataeniobius toweri]